MEFSDILQLAAIYLGFFAVVFGIAFAPLAMWRFFRDLADPGFKQD